MALLIFHEEVSCCLKSEITRTPGVDNLNVRKKIRKLIPELLIYHSLLIKQHLIIKLVFCTVFTVHSRLYFYWPSVQYIYSVIEYLM